MHLRVVIRANHVPLLLPSLTFFIGAYPLPPATQRCAEAVRKLRFGHAQPCSMAVSGTSTVDGRRRGCSPGECNTHT